jgi:23S rRNA (guanosine2251-2'-O)-methyltransferase
MPATRTLHGFHALTARLRERPQSMRAVYVSATRHDARSREFAAKIKGAGIALHAVDDARLDELAGTAHHQGVVAIVDATAAVLTLDELLDALTEPPLLVVLDGVTDPHNLGACLRNADAFGAHAVVVPKDRSAGLTATAAKAASGAADTVPLVAVTNLARTLGDLKERGVWIVAAEAGGESLFDAEVGGPIAWVFGAEGSGLRRLTRETCDRVVGIPLAGSVGSVNVSVACGICLYASRRARASQAKRPAAGGLAGR